MSNQPNKPVLAQPPAPQPKKLSALERIQNLEQAVQSLFQLSDSLIKDYTALKNALQLLNNKVGAITKASVAGEELNDEVLDRIMIESNIEDLTKKVADLVERGTLVPETEVSDNAFVVGKELEYGDKEDGSDAKVLNPRLQFAIKAIKSEMQDTIRGTKIGTTVKIKDKLHFHVIESYSIQTPKELAPEAAPVSPEAAPAVPEATADTNIGSEPTPA
jgi:hypothetical protein